MNLTEVKQEVKQLIRANSERGFLPYSGCNRVCHGMSMILEESLASGDTDVALDIHLYILTEVTKLIAHADTSSGAVTDVVHQCLHGIEACTKSSPDEDKKGMFQKIIKTAKHKAFQEWAEYGYQLLRSAANLVDHEKQAAKVYELFDVLGKMYDDKPYPDQYLITQQIIGQLEGAAAADRYRKEHLHIPEIRALVVEQAMADGDYEAAKKLCLEVLPAGKMYGRTSRWAFKLEQIYAALGDRQKHIEIVRRILLSGESSYYARLKELYSVDGGWEPCKEALLDELSTVYMSHAYAGLLADEGEWTRLLGVVRQTPMFIEDYAIPLAKLFPTETYLIFEDYILSEAALATDRRKYRGVCKIIRAYHKAGAKTEAKAMIGRLIAQYPRRVAMVDELEALDRKLS